VIALIVLGIALGAVVYAFGGKSGSHHGTAH
jgi:hypothetical protein